MDDESRQQLFRLLSKARLGALGTIRDGKPRVSMVSIAPAEDFSVFYIHISRLAQHTREILKDNHVSLMILETDDRRPDPQTLVRVSISGQALVIPQDDAIYGVARQTYLARFPHAMPRFNFSDFSLYRIVPESVRFVGGFALAFRFRPEELTALREF